MSNYISQITINAAICPYLFHISCLQGLSQFSRSITGEAGLCMDPYYTPLNWLWSFVPNVVTDPLDWATKYMVGSGSQETRCSPSSFLMGLSLLAICSLQSHLKLESRVLSFAYNLFHFSVTQILLKLWRSMAMILSCSVQNFKTIAQLKRMLWTNYISWDFLTIQLLEPRQFFGHLFSPVSVSAMRLFQGIAWRIRTWISDLSKVHGASMGPNWGRQDPGGPHVGHKRESST